MSNLPSGTVTFLFTDIEGSTKLAQEYPETWEVSQARHHRIMRQAIEANNGVIFQIIGDAFCAAFYKAGNALKAAIQAQQKLHDEPWQHVNIRVRMGIHTGEAEAQGNDYHGYLTLSFVQRLMSAGHGGQVLVSGATENLLRGQLPSDVALRDMGRYHFKDVLQPVRVFQVIAPDLPSGFLPLRSLNILPNNLPAQLTSFVGREKELEDIRKLLDSARMLTLIGPGGSGKTRLSIQAASEVLEQYLDGSWFVDLAPILDPLLVPRTTAMAIGLRDEPQRPVIDMLCDYLHDKQMLIILDNCEHLVEACAWMADRLLHAAPRVRLLASSREALGIGGEVTYRVPALGLPDLSNLPPIESLNQYEAVRLFIERASSAVPGFTVTNENAPALAQVCHHLDGIPLAIELAAAKVRVLSLDQIAKRLGDRFRLLRGGSRTALERHQTLRAAIDWSYNLLLAAEQVLFNRLSIFVGGWTLEAAEAVCAGGLIESEDILDLLEQLINKSLVLMEARQGVTRYQMLETIRQYADEKMMESGERDTLRHRHLEYFLNLAETAEPHLIRTEQLEWLALLEAESENLRLALEWALHKESAEPSLRLCAALGMFWSLQSRWTEGANWLAGALAKPPRDDDPAESAARVRALCQDSRLAELLDVLDRMRTSAELALKLAREGSNQRDAAIARFYVGFALFRYARTDEPLSFWEQSLAEFQAVQDVYWESYNLHWLGSLRSNQGRPEALELIQRSIALARKAGDRLNLAKTLYTYSWFLYLYERVDEARMQLEVAQQLCTQFSTVPITFVQTQRLLADIEWLEGNHLEAERLLLASRAHLRLLGERFTSSLCSGRLGLLAMERRDLSQAQAYLEEMLSTARELELKFVIADGLEGLAIVHSLQGDIETSRQEFRQSFSFLKDQIPIIKAEFLECLLITPYFQKPENSVLLLGAIDRYHKEINKPIYPLLKRYSIRAEEQARASMDESQFAAAFAQGQKLSLDDALEFALERVEAM